MSAQTTDTTAAAAPASGALQQQPSDAPAAVPSAAPSPAPAGSPAGNDPQPTQTPQPTQNMQATQPTQPAQNAQGGQGAEGDGEEKLGEGGLRALKAEREARRVAEQRLREIEQQLRQYTDREKTELQRHQEAAERYRRELEEVRTANARLMAAAMHNIPADLIELLGTGTDEEIEARARLLAQRLSTSAAQPTTEQPPPTAATRPVEALTPGARPASEQPADPNELFRQFLTRRRI